MNITWEDTGRSKFSCVGPNISDMTLQVEGNLLPIIRNENFSDFTYELNTDELFISVGNEKSS